MSDEKQLGNEDPNLSTVPSESPSPAQASSAYPSIIVRAFDDEPKVLYALKMQDNQRYVNVTRALPRTSYVGWPLEDTFDYDAESYFQLVKAYEANDKTALVALYATLRTKPRAFVATLNEPERETEITK